MESYRCVMSSKVKWTYFCGYLTKYSSTFQTERLGMYSPPPLDGFSPPPMSDVSPLREYPPPINGFSENEDDEEELDYDFPIDDAEYDLTGLSDKLKSLEIDKISNLPPREILELQKESSEVKNLCLNGVPLQENGFKCEPPSIISEFKEEVLSNEDITETSEQDDSREPTEVLVNGRDSNEIGDERLSRGAAETETRPDHVCPVSPDNSDSDLNIGEEMVAEESCGGFASEDSEKCIVESNEDIENPEVCTSPTNLSKVETIEQDFGEWTTGNEMSLEDEGWGNFDSGPGEGDEADQHWAQPRTSDPETPDPPLQFDESDDEFGDFGEADTSAKVEENAVQVSDSSTIVKTLETLSEASAQLLLSVFVNLGSLDEETDQLFLDNVVMEENGLFETISNPASCPALDHQWRDSAAHKVIMETLGIDSRVLVSGDIVLFICSNNDS